MLSEDAKVRARRYKEKWKADRYGSGVSKGERVATIKDGVLVRENDKKEGDNLSELKYKELTKMAKEYKIKLKRNISKDDLIAEIKKVT
jgi:hypothetical protein